MPVRTAIQGTRRTLFVGFAILILSGCAEDWTPLEGSFLTELDAFTGLDRAPHAGASEAFWEHWGDGQAELSGYRVTVTRYGEPRAGEMSLIYVTEPHDRRSWIKDDGVAAPNRVEVLKLIRSTQFLTGIYPYSVQAVTFAPVEAWREERFQPVRINLDVQEWCGSVSHRVWPGPGRLRSLRLSYFAGEGETLTETEIPEGTLFEDALLIQLRELDGSFHGGEDWEGWLLPDLWFLRTTRDPVEPVRATISRTLGEREGTPVTHFRLEAGDYWRRFDVEVAPPRRVLGWEASTGDSAELLGTERLAYWSLNAVGDESYREALGIDALGRLPETVGGACTVASPEEPAR